MKENLADVSFLAYSIKIGIRYFSVSTNSGTVSRMLRDVISAYGVQTYRVQTAGAHQPTFFSLRGPAKALHQRAPKARVKKKTSH